MLGQIFNRETGGLTNEESIDSTVIVEGIRQICLTFKRLEIACIPEREQAAIESYIAIERSFDLFSVPEAQNTEFISVCAVLWDNLTSSIELARIVPKHGPGATAEHISGNGKYAWHRWHERLEPYFPLIDNGFPLGIPVNAEELKMVSLISETQEQPVRIVTVPKTLKSPRVIAIEPCCVQYTQQGIRELLYSSIESYWLTAGHVNFRDQSINQKLAISASSTGQLATIDLSDASDRVPHDLAMEMFRANPDLRDAIEACRTTRAELPSGEIISPLRKFASMGSALCFPVEAMYFYTICIVALLKEHNLPATLRNVFRVSRGVYVYGDDILVPSTNASIVLDYLQKYNCKVNSNKTFTTGKFRESCGIDAYDGESVTPTYLRRLRPENRHQVQNIISWVATSNLFYLRGYWRTASFMRKCIDELMGPLPYVSETSSALGYISFLGYRSASRWNDSLHRLEIKAFVPKPVFRIGKLEGYSALSKSLKQLESANQRSPVVREGSLESRLLEASKAKAPIVSNDPRHLERYARHGAVALQRRWTAALT
jgi:hypothetical protein